MRTLPLALAVLATLALGACAERDHDAQPPRLISVQGEGSVVAVPDRATVTLSIAARDKDLARAQTQADATVARVMKVAAELGLAPEKVQTTGISIQPEFDWRDGKRVALGYLVHRTTTIELEDLTKLGTLMERALVSGVNEVSPPVLSSSRHKALVREALARAAEDARLNAEAIADALGAGVGDLYGASGQGAGEAPPMPKMRTMAMAADTAEVAQTYSEGEIRVTATVQAQFEVE